MPKSLLIILFTFFNLLAFGSNKIIYGDNDLIYTEEHLDSTKRDLALSVSMIVNSSELVTILDKTLYSLNSSTLGSTAPMCEDIPWKNEVALGSCSGVLIAKDKVLTAAHCIDNSDFDCKKKSFIFDVKANFMMGTQGQYFTHEQVYRCKEIVNYELNSQTGLDYAVIELDREVVNRAPVTLSNKKHDLDEGVFMIGHPLGLGSMVSDNGELREEFEHIYTVELDSFVGNSGAPVFSSADNSLVGILSQGEEDFLWNKEGKCFDLKECESGECRGEDVVKLDSILTHRGLNK